MTTVPHTPQENVIAERINRTIFVNARASLASSILPDQYAVYDYVDKYNHTPIQPQTNYLKRTGLAVISTFQPFRQYGHVFNPAANTKSQPRAFPARYIHRCSEHHYVVLNLQKKTALRCQAADFRQYNPNKDPVQTTPTHPAHRPPMTHFAYQQTPPNPVLISTDAENSSLYEYD